MGFVCKGCGASVVRRERGWLHAQSGTTQGSWKTVKCVTSALSAIVPSLPLAMWSCFIEATSKYRRIVLVREWRAHLSKFELLCFLENA